MTQPVIKIEGAGKAFARYRGPGHQLGAAVLPRLFPSPDLFWAVRGVTLDIYAGESLGIIGTNGSGKSTLLQMICGIYPPTEGSIRCSGRVAALLELGAGFNPEFTGRENIYLNAAMLGFDRTGIESRIEDILAFADIGSFIDEPVKTYSSGMFVRVAFSVAIHVDPRILVVDEALAVGDARFQAKCMKRIRAMQDDGATILFVAHDVIAVRSLCQRALWLDHGQVRQLGPVFEVTARYMEHLFSDGFVSDPGVIEHAQPVPPLAGEGRDQKNGGEFATSVDDRLLPSASSETTNSGPVNHWGSHLGTITFVELRSTTRGSTGVYAWGEHMELVVEFGIPRDCDTRHLTVAFSLKDLRGTDLMVGSTQDVDGGGFEGIAGRARVTFGFDMRLTPGRYLLVVAIEDRTGTVFEYFEYVEGAAYFAVVADGRRFGAFNLPLEVACSSIPTNARGLESQRDE